MRSPVATAATRSGSTAPRKASAAAVARAKLRRWKGPGAREPTSGAGILGGEDQLAPRSRATRSASSRTAGAHPAQDQGRLVVEHGELLGGDLQLGLAQPLGVIEADRGQHGDPRGDRVGRVEPAAEPRLDRRHFDPGRGEGDEAAAVAASNWVTASPSSARSVDARCRRRDPGDGLLELGLADLLDRGSACVRPSARRAAMSRRRRACRAPRAAPPPSASPRTCRWCRQRGSRRSGAAACRAPWSACTSGRGRASSRSAPASPGRPRVYSSISSSSSRGSAPACRAPPRPPRPAPWRRSPRWRVCARRARPRRSAPRGACRGGSRPPRRRAPREASTLTGPTEATGSPRRSRRSRSARGGRRTPRRHPVDHRRGDARRRDADQVAPGAQAAGQGDLLVDVGSAPGSNSDSSAVGKA